MILTSHNTLTKIENTDMINSQTAAGSTFEPLDYRYELPIEREYKKMKRK